MSKSFTIDIRSWEGKGKTKSKRVDVSKPNHHPKRRGHKTTGREGKEKVDDSAKKLHKGGKMPRNVQERQNVLFIRLENHSTCKLGSGQEETREGGKTYPPSKGEKLTQRKKGRAPHSYQFKGMGSIWKEPPKCQGPCQDYDEGESCKSPPSPTAHSRIRESKLLLGRQLARPGPRLGHEWFQGKMEGSARLEKTRGSGSS